MYKILPLYIFKFKFINLITFKINIHKMSTHGTPPLTDVIKANPGNEVFMRRLLNKTQEVMSYLEGFLGKRNSAILYMTVVHFYSP